MTQASLKTLLLLAIMAITSSTGQLFADAPEEDTDSKIQDRLQLVEAQCADCTNQNDCIKEPCGPDCTGTSCGKCKKCRPGIWNRIKSVFSRNKCGNDYCEFNVHCDHCRRLGRNCGRCGFNGSRGFGNGCDKDRPWLPSGCGGKGCPPFGMYQMVYPVNPSHCDPRDRNVHAAQGYGVPMSVPLAPVVRHQYNYSWGVPASRLTPISNYAPGGGMYGPGYPGPMPSNYCPSCQPGMNR